jgi:CheY-like chemotaxis protein
MMASLSPANSQKSITVLYIEDDLFNRQLVRLILEKRENITLLEAGTGAAGLQCFREHRPEIVLLDLSLPDSSGYEILKNIQRDNDINSPPVIAVSGDSLPEDISKGINAGFQGYITKPIIIEELFKALDIAIASLAK